MRKSSYLQTLYLQKPWLLILLIAIIATLPWIGLGDFYTKGEPREAALAISMLHDGNWIIPNGFADEFAYKPPLNHWLIAGFSYLFNNGEVTPFTSRLPSVLGFIGLIGICFMFFARRRSTLEAFVACLIIITCFEIHRAAVTTRLDMLLTFFIVTGIIQLYIWYEKKKNRYLISSWIFLTLATLVKGPVGIVLPCGIFAVYLLINKCNFFKVVGKCLLVIIPSFIIPLIWYILAYKVKGDEFLHLVLAENFGRFFSISDNQLDIKYRLGVENPWWFYFVSILAGFIPHTLLIIVSVFFLKYKKTELTIKQTILTWWSKLTQNKFQLYCFLVIIVFFVFFTIPTSKRSVYIMPLYPFVALFMAQYMLYLVQNKPKSIRIYTLILDVLIGILSLVSVLCVLHVLNFTSIGSLFVKRERSLHDIELISNGFSQPTLIGVIVILILVYAFCHSTYILKKQSNLKVLMASFGLMIAANMFLDGNILPQLKNGYSSKPFAKHITEKYNDLEGNVYVINDLLKYPNPYGLSFYLGNNLRNLEKEKPDTGYFLAGEPSKEDIIKSYPNYQFEELEKSSKYTDYKMPIVLYRIKKIK